MIGLQAVAWLDLPSSVGAAEPRAGLDWIRARRSFARDVNVAARREPTRGDERRCAETRDRGRDDDARATDWDDSTRTRDLK